MSLGVIISKEISILTFDIKKSFIIYHHLAFRRTHNEKTFNSKVYLSISIVVKERMYHPYSYVCLPVISHYEEIYEG